jgi:hypothetical protein
MSDVGLSRQTHLPAMRLLAEQIRLADQRDFLWRQIDQTVDEDPVSRIVLGIRTLRSVVNHRHFCRQAVSSNRIHEHALPVPSNSGLTAIEDFQANPAAGNFAQSDHCRLVPAQHRSAVRRQQ